MFLFSAFGLFSQREQAARQSFDLARRVAPKIALERSKPRAKAKQIDIARVIRGDMSTASFLKKWKR